MRISKKYLCIAHKCNNKCKVKNKINAYIELMGGEKILDSLVIHLYIHM